MRVCAHTHPADDLLADIPRLRAYAWLMTNDRCIADQQVQETLKRLIASQVRWCDRPYERVSVFAILRSFLARAQFQSPDVVDGSLGLEDITQSLAGVGRALAQLNFFDREAVILTRAVRFSDSDTAAICECSPAMVGRRALRGVAKLAERMPAASVRSLVSAARLAVSPDTNAALQ